MSQPASPGGGPQPNPGATPGGTLIPPTPGTPSMADVMTILQSQATNISNLTTAVGNLITSSGSSGGVVPGPLGSGLGLGGGPHGSGTGPATTVNTPKDFDSRGVIASLALLKGIYKADDLKTRKEDFDKWSRTVLEALASSSITDAIRDFEPHHEKGTTPSDPKYKPATDAMRAVMTAFRATLDGNAFLECDKIRSISNDGWDLCRCYHKLKITAHGDSTKRAIPLGSAVNGILGLAQYKPTTVSGLITEANTRVTTAVNAGVTPESLAIATIANNLHGEYKDDVKKVLQCTKLAEVGDILSVTESTNLARQDRKEDSQILALGVSTTTTTTPTAPGHSQRSPCRHCGSCSHRGARCPNRPSRIAALSKKGGGKGGEDNRKGNFTDNNNDRSSRRGRSFSRDRSVGRDRNYSRDRSYSRDRYNDRRGRSYSRSSRDSGSERSRSRTPSRSKGRGRNGGGYSGRRERRQTPVSKFALTKENLNKLSDSNSDSCSTSSEVDSLSWSSTSTQPYMPMSDYYPMSKFGKTVTVINGSENMMEKIDKTTTNSGKTVLDVPGDGSRIITSQITNGPNSNSGGVAAVESFCPPINSPGQTQNHDHKPWKLSSNLPTVNKPEFCTIASLNTNINPLSHWNGERVQRQRLVADSGAEVHAFDNVSVFTRLLPQTCDILTADGTAVEGRARWGILRENNLNQRKALYHPRLGRSYLSVTECQRTGLRVTFPEYGGVEIHGKSFTVSGTREGGIPYVEMEFTDNKSIASISTGLNNLTQAQRDELLFHQRSGCSTKLSAGLICLACLLGTDTGKRPAAKIRDARWEPDDSDQRHQCDYKTGICAKSESMIGTTVILGIIDEWDRVPSVLLQKSSKQASEGILKIYRWRRPPRELRSDNGPEFQAVSWGVSLAKLQIKYSSYAPPYTPTRNSRIERLWRTLVNMVRKIMLGVDSRVTDMAYMAAAFLYSVRPRKFRNSDGTTDITTPWERKYKFPFSYSKLRKFGCQVFTDDHDAKKRESRWIQSIFLGYSPKGSSYLSGGWSTDMQFTLRESGHCRFVEHYTVSNLNHLKDKRLIQLLEKSVHSQIDGPAIGSPLSTLEFLNVASGGNQMQSVLAPDSLPSNTISVPPLSDAAPAVPHDATCVSNPAHLLSESSVASRGSESSAAEVVPTPGADPPSSSESDIFKSDSGTENVSDDNTEIQHENTIKNANSASTTTVERIDRDDKSKLYREIAGGPLPIVVEIYSGRHLLERREVKAAKRFVTFSRQKDYRWPNVTKILTRCNGNLIRDVRIKGRPEKSDSTEKPKETRTAKGRESKKVKKAEQSKFSNSSKSAYAPRKSSPRSCKKVPVTAKSQSVRSAAASNSTSTSKKKRKPKSFHDSSRLVNWISMEKSLIASITAQSKPDYKRSTTTTKKPKKKKKLVYVDAKARDTVPSHLRVYCPISRKEATEGPERHLWKVSDKKEISDMRKQKIWRERGPGDIQLLRRHPPTRCHLVRTRKRCGKRKSRLVADGSQSSAGSSKDSNLCLALKYI